MLHFYIENYIEENYGRNIDPGNNILQIMYGIKSMLDYLNPNHLYQYSIYISIIFSQAKDCFL